MRMHSVFAAAAILLAVSSTAAMAQGGDCCAIPGSGKDDDNNPSVWGVSPEAGNAFGSSNVHHPDMMARQQRHGDGARFGNAGPSCAPPPRSAPRSRKPIRPTAIGSARSCFRHACVQQVIQDDAAERRGADAVERETRDGELEVAGAEHQRHRDGDQVTSV